jgi:phosphatidylglycerol:prolipoprotein diacylglycerol transferase
MQFEHYGIIFSLGGLTIPLRYYGLILVSGAFLGGYLASLEARRRGENPEYIWDALIWAMVGGIIGARLWHVFTPPPSMVAAGRDTAWYFAHPIEILLVWNGGLGIPGAVAGGMAALYLFTRRHKLNFAKFADLAAPGLALGQAIGRWGNYVNQELYGAPTTLPWGLSITDPAQRVAGFEDPALRFHPVFLYESLGCLLIVLALLYIGRRYGDRLKNGDLFLIYLILYPFLRFLLEFVRLDSSQLFGLNANQTLMLILMVVAAYVLTQRHRRVRRHELRARGA